MGREWVKKKQKTNDTYIVLDELGEPVEGF